MGTPTGMALDGERVLVTSATPGVFAVDIATGDRTLLSDTGTVQGPLLLFPQGIAADGERIVLVDSNHLLQLDRRFGQRVIVSE